MNYESAVSIIHSILTVEENLKAAYEESRDYFEKKMKLIDAVQEQSIQLRKSTSLRNKLKNEDIQIIQALIDASFQYIDRDRVNTVTGILGGVGDDSQNHDYDPEDGAWALELQPNSAVNAATEEEILDPERAWNSKYTNRKMNASFSMFRPIV